MTMYHILYNASHLLESTFYCILWYVCFKKLLQKTTKYYSHETLLFIPGIIGRMFPIICS